MNADVAYYDFHAECWRSFDEPQRFDVDADGLDVVLTLLNEAGKPYRRYSIDAMAALNGILNGYAYGLVTNDPFIKALQEKRDAGASTTPDDVTLTVTDEKAS